MKRLGTRLGMFVGVIGLTVMAITQAQKDYSSTTNTREFLELKNQLTPPPRPISGDELAGVDWPAPPDTQIVRGSDAPDESAPMPSASSISLASHNEPVDDSSGSSAPSFSMPTFGNTGSTNVSAPAASAPPTLTMPSFNLPGTLPPSGTNETVGSGVASEQEIPSGYQFGSAPALQSPQSTFAPAPAYAQAPAAGPASAPSTMNIRSPESSPYASAPSSPTTGGDNQSVVMKQRMGLSGQSPAGVGNGYAAPNGASAYNSTEALTAPGFDMNSAPGAHIAAAPKITSKTAPAPEPVVEQPEPEPTPTYEPAPNQRPVDANVVLAQPGSRLLEGAQAPCVTIHKRAPEEINVGKKATFAIQLRNTGPSEALNVVVRDVVPEGMDLIEATPKPELQGKHMRWDFGDLEPGGERTITLTMMPMTEGELGSVARLSFEAAASVRSLSTRPELKIVQRAPEQVLIGQQVEIEIEVSNPGTGTAHGVVLQENVPEGLEHAKGKELDNLLGDIEPGQMRRQRLILKAVKAGVAENFIQLVSEDQPVAENSLPIEVVAPQLTLQMQGPSRRFLERPANFTLQIENSGSAPATNVDVVAYLDRGLTFVSTEYKGQYDSARHAVFWSLAELPVGEIGQVPLVLLPVEPGQQMVRLEAQADLGISATTEKPISVETLAEITFSVNDDHDPIEAGAMTTYAIRITNSGSREDSNVQLKLAIPPGLEFVKADQQAQVDGNGNVSFAPLPRMGSQDEHVFRVTVRGRNTGTHLLKASLTSDQSKIPVTKEESTMVYSD